MNKTILENWLQDLNQIEATLQQGDISEALQALATTDQHLRKLRENSHEGINPELKQAVYLKNEKIIAVLQRRLNEKHQENKQMTKKVQASIAYNNMRRHLY